MIFHLLAFLYRRGTIGQQLDVRWWLDIWEHMFSTQAKVVHFHSPPKVKDTLSCERATLWQLDVATGQ